MLNDAAAAKSLQSCSTLCNPIDSSPPGSTPDSPGKNTGVGCHFILQCMKVKSESEVAQSVQLFTIPWTAAYQAPPSMGFFQARVLEWGLLDSYQSTKKVLQTTRAWRFICVLTRLFIVIVLIRNQYHEVIIMKKGKLFSS